MLFKGPVCVATAEKVYYSVGKVQPPTCKWAHCFCKYTYALLGNDNEKFILLTSYDDKYEHVTHGP